MAESGMETQNSMQQCDIVAQSNHTSIRSNKTNVYSSENTTLDGQDGDGDGDVQFQSSDKPSNSTQGSNIFGDIQHQKEMCKATCQFCSNVFPMPLLVPHAKICKENVLQSYRFNKSTSEIFTSDEKEENAILGEKANTISLDEKVESTTFAGKVDNAPLNGESNKITLTSNGKKENMSEDRKVENAYYFTGKVNNISQDEKVRNTTLAGESNNVSLAGRTGGTQVGADVEIQIRRSDEASNSVWKVSEVVLKHKCLLCFKFFLFKNDLRNHYRKVHKIGYVVCANCGQNVEAVSIKDHVCNELKPLSLKDRDGLEPLLFQCTLCKGHLPGDYIKQHEAFCMEKYKMDRSACKGQSFGPVLGIPGALQGPSARSVSFYVVKQKEIQDKCPFCFNMIPMHTLKSHLQLCPFSPECLSGKTNVGEKKGEQKGKDERGSRSGDKTTRSRRVFKLNTV